MMEETIEYLGKYIQFQYYCVILICISASYECFSLSIFSFNTTMLYLYTYSFPMNVLDLLTIVLI